MFQGSLKGVSRKFLVCFKKDLRVLRVFHGSLKGFSRKFRVVSQKFKGCLKEV